VDFISLVGDSMVGATKKISFVANVEQKLNGSKHIKEDF
jgi:hypothetical protein